jgi:hypothetical protein
VYRQVDADDIVVACSNCGDDEYKLDIITEKGD